MKRWGIIELGALVFAMATTTAVDAQSAPPKPIYQPFDYGDMWPGSACTEEELAAGMVEEQCLDYRDPEWESAWEEIAGTSEQTDDFDGGLRGCSGACSYTDSSTEITCTVPSGSSENIVVGMHYPSDKFIMCEQVPGGGWTRIGYCTRGTIAKVQVNGSSSDDNIMFIKNFQNSSNDDCDFDTYDDEFSTRLAMDGKGDCDHIYGSQYDDTTLTGEYVESYSGDDRIYLDNDNFDCLDYSHTWAFGGAGNDLVYGTSNADYVYADTWGVTGGNDYVTVYGGSDRVDLYQGRDYGYGGDRDDSIWGGPGDYDCIYGENDDDTLYGGSGTGDTCNGGSGTDACEEETAGGEDSCNNMISCESTF